MRIPAFAAIVVLTAASCAQAQSAQETLILRGVSTWLPAQEFMPANETCRRAMKMRGTKRADAQDKIVLICTKKGEYPELGKVPDTAQITISAKLTEPEFPVGMFRMPKYAATSAPKIVPIE